MGKHGVKDATRTQLPYWQYLSGDAHVLVAATRRTITLPGDATIVEMRPRNAAVFFAINGLATTGSGGYIPQDGAEIIGPLSNLNSLTVISTGAPTVHVMFFKEV